ncbi:TetR/AcrR family transcriptional regulator [Fodinibius halophilus]|uniref:TetR/AcrR family transcriptional regulator n=1 Tax=Fodinibius halophilus TaxID=1736908 RepID=A0A6M1TPJ3_9BACT|nr:TetR/AcrR family transcriptional regulator [Fodinibius halophilus]NGP90210.1 TetR/AcrR family transcriptional regulator [Fodinibius halophilus]
MSEQEMDTRTEIIEAARAEFFTHGYEGARLQKIADQIGVTKAMIHYYFNTKKELFERVFTQSIRDIFGGLGDVLDQDLPLFKKIEELVEACLQQAKAYPEVLTFVVTESSRKPEWLQPIFDEQVQLELGDFEDELEEAASNYQIASVDAHHLLLNIFSLCYYPVLSDTINRSLLKESMHSDNGKANIDRKGIVLDTILNWLTA